MRVLVAMLAWAVAALLVRVLLVEKFNWARAQPVSIALPPLVLIGYFWMAGKCGRPCTALAPRVPFSLRFQLEDACEQQRLFKRQELLPTRVLEQVSVRRWSMVVLVLVLVLVFVWAVAALLVLAVASTLGLKRKQRRSLLELLPQV